MKTTISWRSLSNLYFGLHAQHSLCSDPMPRFGREPRIEADSALANRGAASLPFRAALLFGFSLLLAACETNPPAPEAKRAADASAALLSVNGKLTAAGVAAWDRGHALLQAHDDAGALGAWLPLAEAGHAKSQFNIGTLLETGRGPGMAKNLSAAIGWHIKAANNGHAESNCVLGRLLHKTDGSAAGQRRALDWYLRGAGLGQVFCMHNAAAILLNGEGVPANRGVGLEWLTRAASLGDAGSQASLGSVYLHGTYSVPQNYPKARLWLVKAVAAGHVNATHNFAMMFDEGWGGKKDTSQAARLYRLAANGGQAQSANNLGLLYRHGDGVAVNHVQAAAMFRRAVELNNFDGAVNLGDMYFMGRGVARDWKAAAKLYQRASEAGLAWGDCRLAAMMRHGEGFKRDLPAAKTHEAKARIQIPSADCKTALSKSLR